ncbi:MAG: NUDIX domain-containing protein [Erysipelotrichaceae bacterium]|nr:NUDIX domain-containing protein [Erysipelotrichaceae bacterium]
MKHCMECGSRLERKELEGEGEIPYCPKCHQFRFPMFNVAVSMIVLNPQQDKVLLIEQYGKKGYILVAGYVNQGEDAEEAVCREISEEIGLEVEQLSFNHSHYFKKSNTLMLNFTAVVKDEQVHSNEEVDRWNWFTVEQAKEAIRDQSLAQAFLNGYFDKEYHFEICDEPGYFYTD